MQALSWPMSATRSRYAMTFRDDPPIIERHRREHSDPPPPPAARAVREPTDSPISSTWLCKLCRHRKQAVAHAMLVPHHSSMLRPVPEHACVQPPGQRWRLLWRSLRKGPPHAPYYHIFIFIFSVPEPDMIPALFQDIPWVTAFPYNSINDPQVRPPRLFFRRSIIFSQIIFRARSTWAASSQPWVYSGPSLRHTS